MKRVILMLNGKDDDRFHISLSKHESKKFLNFIEEYNIHKNNKYTWRILKDKYPFMER